MVIASLDKYYLRHPWMLKIKLLHGRDTYFREDGG